MPNSSQKFPKPSRNKDFKINILYEDEYIVVVDKPADLLVYLPAGKSYESTLKEIISKKININNQNERSGIVHRLDKETSGVLIIAKNINSEIRFKELFKSRKIKKKYLALVWGKIEPSEAIIKIPLGRSSKDRLRVVPKASGKTAKTKYKIIKYYKNLDCSLLEVEIETGRMHQIRVHLSSIGFPVVGDKRYSKKRTSLKRHFLHASEISFLHPYLDKNIKIKSRLPRDLESFLK